MRCRDEHERLVAEQAVLAYRAVNRAADDAVFGHGMRAMEDVALEASRDHARRLLEAASRRRLEAEKNDPRRANRNDAPRATDGSSTSGRPRGS